MTDSTIELHHLTHTGPRGTSVAVVAPAWGANIVAFGFHPRELMWPIAFLEIVDAARLAAKPTGFGAPLLAPTPGRTGTGEPGAFTFDGRPYRLAQPRHGFLRNVPWTVAERTPSSILCTLDVTPQTAALGESPFAFRAEHRVSVSEARLDARITFHSTASTDQPIGMGWHPYLQRDPGCRLRIPAASLWEVDGSSEPVPTGRRVPVAGPSDFRAGRVLGPPQEEHWDATFADLAYEDGVSQSGLESEAALLGADQQPRRVGVRRLVELRRAANVAPMDNIQLYTAPGRDAVAVEPFSAPPDAVNLLAHGHEQTGLVRLRPGGQLVFEMGLVLDVRIAGQAG